MSSTFTPEYEKLRAEHLDRMQLKNLMSVTKGEMILTIFDSRYSDGFVGVLTYQASHGAAIIENFGGGDSDWSSVRFPLVNLTWFPIVICAAVEEVMPAMQAKLNEIAEQTVDHLIKWGYCVEKVGELIESDTHWRMNELPKTVTEAYAQL